MIILHLIIAISIYCFLPENGAALQWERDQNAPLTWWTSHFVHWSALHLFWDCLVYLIFGYIARRYYRLNLSATYLLFAPILLGCVALLSPEITTYRGLSGFDTVLFTYVAVAAIREAVIHAEWADGLFAGGLLVGVFLKIAYEITAGRPLFAQDLGELVRPLPEIHLVGVALGFLLALGISNRPNEPASSPKPLPSTP
ncbi:MAG: rhombosortase [Puniceicoccaceae bacterium]